MAKSNRARNAGTLALSLLLLSLLGPTGALASVAPPATPALRPLGPPPATSCQGVDACTGATGNIGENSCNGDRACNNATGNIGENSCGGSNTCADSSANIGDNSCVWSIGACPGVAGTVGDNSCNGFNTCYYKTAGVGDYSCNGEFACTSEHDAVGTGSCNGPQACNPIAATVGDCAHNVAGFVPAICFQPDGRIRRVGKNNMVGNDIYNTDGTNQTLTDTLGDRRVRFVITIQNDGQVADSFTIHSNNGIFAVIIPPTSFYHGWNPAEDITAGVMAGTYTTPTIQPGGVYRIRAVVRPLQINFNHLTAGPGIGHYSWLVTATSVGNTTKADAVRFAIDVPFT